MGVFKSTCPHCGKALDLQKDWVGMEVTCPYCNKTFTVKEKSDSNLKKLKLARPQSGVTDEKAAQDESSTTSQETATGIKQTLLSKPVIMGFSLILASWIVYWTRGIWNGIYTNTSIFIPVISIFLVLWVLLRSLKIMKAAKDINKLIFVTTVLFIVLSTLSCIFFVYSPIYQIIPTEAKLMKWVEGQRVAKFLTFYSTTDQDSTISKAVFAKKSFFDFSGKLTIRRKGKEYERSVSVNCKIFDGKLKPVFHLDVDYIKNPKMLQEDAALFLDVEFNSEKHPQLEEAKAISVRSDESKKNHLIYTIDLYGEETEVEVDINDIKANDNSSSEDVAKKQPETPSQSAEQSANLKVKTKTQIVEGSTRVTIEKEATVDIKQKQKQAPEPAVAIEEAPRIIKTERAKLIATVSVWRDKIWYYEMGKKLLEGNGVPRNDKKGFIYLQKSLNLKYYDAAFELAKCYISGFGTPSNRTKAFNIIKRLADMGNADARLLLSDYYFQGMGTTTNGQEGFKILKELAKENNVRAKVRIALCYWWGIVVKQNESRAFNDICEAAKENNPEALYYLAQFYFFGIGTKEGQNTEAYDNFCEAAKYGHQLANIWVSYLRWNAIGTERDMAAAKKELENMATKGFAEAQRTLAYNYLTKDFVIDGIKNWRNVSLSDGGYDAVKWLKKAADQGNAQAQLDLGCCYALGIGSEKNIDMMKKWWKNAIRTDVHMVMNLT